MSEEYIIFSAIYERECQGEYLEIDARLKHLSDCVIIGPWQKKKTLWCKRLLKCAKDIFNTPVNKIY